jgi:hypothetical protein
MQKTAPVRRKSGSLSAAIPRDQLAWQAKVAAKNQKSFCFFFFRKRRSVLF